MHSWEYFQYFREAGGQIEAPEPENSAHAVQMMSVHAAKGLEFPVVFILSVAPRRFPHSEQKPVIEFPEALRKGPPPPANIHEQEERRLLYVGLTRAEDRLYVSSVAKPGKKPSVFISDLTSDPAVEARDIERIQVPEAPPETAGRAARPSPCRASALPPPNRRAACLAMPRARPESIRLSPSGPAAHRRSGRRKSFSSAPRPSRLMTPARRNSCSAII